MKSKPNLKRIREVLMMNSTNDFDKKSSEDDESNSNPDYSNLETESDDTCADEYKSKDDSSDSGSTDDDTDISNPPESIEKNGVLWTTEINKARGRLSASNIMKAKTGAVTSIGTIMDAFKLFITDEILNEIVWQTNRYAKRWLNQQEQKGSKFGASETKLYHWRNLDRVELEAFIGLLIQSGISHSNHESINQLWDISDSLPIYHATMSSHRFKEILRFLRFDDRQRRDKTDRIAPIRFVFERFTKQLSQHFTPSENLTIDEQLVPFRGRCSLVQFMPK